VKIEKLVRPSVRGLKAYEAKEIPCKVKLDANESPYGYDISRAKIATNRYPDPEARALRDAIAKTHGVTRESVLLGNGSDELISCLITTFGGPVLHPSPTFVMYANIAIALGEKDVPVALNSEFDLDETAMLAAIRRHKPKLVFLSTPNNPTGNCFDAGAVLRIIERAPGIVVVDEAYQPFAGDKGYCTFLADYPNLVVMRTLSKIGLAALRLGYMVASTQIIAEVNKVRLPYNVNSFSQAHALHALKKGTLMRKAIKTIATEREAMMAAMSAMEGIEVYPSEANFIMFRVADQAAMHAALLKRGVLIKNLGAMVKGCMRVTVGTPSENKAFIKALREALGNGK